MGVTNYLLVRICIFLVAAGAFCVAVPAYAQQVRLPITFHKQQYSLSCEVAALKTALAVHGVEVAEQTLIGQLPFDPTPKTAGIWGDPNKGFVGSIAGRMLVTGYGVYWDPIATLGARYAVTEVMRNGSAKLLAQTIAQGNPVIIWGYYGDGKAYSWRTPAGANIHAVDGEHTSVAYGFDGPANAPTRFYLMDPIQGAISKSTDELMSNWGSWGHMGVIVSSPRTWVRAPYDSTIWEIDSKQIRHEIISWSAFVNRGGSSSSVQSITAAALKKYAVGASIR